MSINVTGPDGRVHTFPNGTTAADIERAMQRAYGSAPSQRQATARAAQALDRRPAPTRQRSLWERFDDRLQDSLQNSYGALARWMVSRGIEGEYEVRDPETGQVIQRRRDNNQAIRAGIVSDERSRRETLERRTEGDEWYRAPGGIVGRGAAGVATIGGELVGAGLDPTSWIGGGRKIVTRMVTSAFSSAGSDAVAQGSDISVGVTDDWDVRRTAFAAATGGALSGVSDLIGLGVRQVVRRFLAQPEAAAKVDLEIGDQLNAPAFSLSEIGTTRPMADQPRASPTAVEAPLVSEMLPEAAPRSAEGTSSGTPSKGPSESPTGPDGAAVQSGWQSVDWGARKSPERAAAASRHIEGLGRWVKPDQVQAFLRALDDGLPEGDTVSRINPRWVDWDTLGDPREVLGFTAALSDIFRTTYEAAGSPRQGWQATAQAARELDFTLSDIIKTHADITGEGGIAARAGALRDAALASDKVFYDQLVEVRAALTAGDKSGVAKLAESLNRTVVLGAMDAGASSEIARALQYRQRRPDFAQSDLQAAVTEISNLLNKGGDLDDVALQSVLDTLADAYGKGGSVGLRQAVAQMREMGFWDYVGYYATANLLSAPTTHIRNLTGTPIHAIFQIGERYAAAGIGGLRRAAGLGSKERVTFREAVAYTAGITQAWSEAWTLAGAAWKRGASVADLRSSVMSTEMASQVPLAFSSERWAKWKANPWSLTTMGDALGVAVFETVRTLGFRPSVAADEFFKAYGRRMQLNALAYREAAYRSALAEPEVADDVFRDTLRAIQDEPTAAAFRVARDFFGGDRKAAQGVYEPGSEAEEMALILRAIDTRQMAIDHAQLLTFQDVGPVTKKLDAALRAVPLVKHLFVPFVRTPIALLKAGMVSRNPIIGSTVAALELTTKEGQAKHKALFDALASEEAALSGARGGAEADLVLARQLVGASVLGMFWMLWAGGNVVGKQSPEERQAGVQDYSVRLPNGEWVQFTGMSPVGEMLGLVADTAKALRDHDLNDDGIAAVIGAVAAAARNNVVNKSFLSGLGDFMEMMTGGSYQATSDEASGEAIGRQLTQAVAPRIVPGGSLLRRVAQDQDPVVRDARSFTEMILAGVPTMSQSIAARRDFLGRPLVRPAGQRGAFQAFNVSSPSDDALERELASLARANVGFRISPTPRGDMTPAEYSHLLEVQGQLYRRRGLNMEETLRQLIASPDYLNAYPEGREHQIKRVIERFREEGRRAVSNPRSEFYLGTWARRNGLVKWKDRARSRNWSSDQAWGRVAEFGLSPDDPEVQELHEALFPE